jgi:hypothetical protein
MTQHLLSGLHVFLLSLFLVLAPSGCWWLRQAPPPDRPNPSQARLAKWGVSRLAVVEFSDATRQNVGTRVADTFRNEMAIALGKEWVRLNTMTMPAGPQPVGLIGVSQAQQLGRLNDVNGIVSGQVLAYHYQRKTGRVWVSVSLRLLETTRGTIIWSRNATGMASVRADQPITEDELNSGYNVAIRLAAKEFIHDLVGNPT